MGEIKFLALAQNELDDIYESLEYQEEQQGHKFIDEVERMLNLIKRYPTAWKKSTRNTHKSLIKGFPYAIIYQYANESIVVVAIMNLRKKPIHWASKTVSEYSTYRISSLPETMYTR